MTRSTLSLILLALTATGCEQKLMAQGPSGAAAAPAPAAGARGAPSSAAAQAVAASRPAEPSQHDCSGYGGARLLNDTVTTKPGPKGETILHAGNPFGKVAARAKVSELLSNPAAFAGKTVQVEGNVSAMCSHARSWFALAAEDKSGRFLRVFATPVFLAPRDAIGKTAVAEGVIEVVAVDGASARHFAEGHKLGGDVQARDQVVLRATGAEFR